MVSPPPLGTPGGATRMVGQTRSAAIVLATVVGGAACLGLTLAAMAWWLHVVDDPLATVVNQSGSSVAHGRFQAERDYGFDGLAAGAKRRFPHHARGEISYLIDATLASGARLQAQGPYHASVPDMAEDGPDEESIVLLQPGAVRIVNVDDLATLPDGAAVGAAAGYDSDRRIVSPSGVLDAVIRVGPSLTADRAWRVILVEHGQPAAIGATVFEATHVKDLMVRWTSDRSVRIGADKAHIKWTHSFASLFVGKDLSLEHVRTEIGR